MKKPIICALFLVMPICYVFGARNSSSKLVVASYSSFADNWGKGKDIVPIFEAENGVEVELLDLGSGFEFIGSLKSGRTKADVAVGVDDAHLGMFDGAATGAKAFDYGYFAFVFDTRSSIKPPSRLSDLANPEYAGKFIIVDPQTSFVGFGLLRWAVAAYGEEEGIRLFNRMADNALTVAPSWTVGYSLFTNGEAPLMISYTTSPVYHYGNGEDHVVSLLFEEGNLETREYAFVFPDSPKKDLASRFVDFLARNSVDIAVSNVMYPVEGEENLPEGYFRVKKPEKILRSDAGDELLAKWRQTL